MNSKIDTETKTSFLDKFKNASWIITLLFIVLTCMQTCSMSKKINVLTKNVITLEKQLPLNIDTSIRLEGLRTSKRMLYDNNAIIRTAIRPDDRMNEYDAEIKKLQAK